jgi:hypothetical protein
MTGSFYDEGAVRQAAITAFYGWGYDFYRRENQLRQDDQTVRANASGLLSEVRGAISEAETAERRKLTPPTREHPLPNPTIMEAAQALERLAAEVGRIEGIIRSMPVLGNDRMTQRYRTERSTLERLVELDQDMIGHALCLRDVINGAGGEISSTTPTVRAHLAALTSCIQARQDFLAG